MNYEKYSETDLWVVSNRYMDFRSPKVYLCDVSSIKFLSENEISPVKRGIFTFYYKLSRSLITSIIFWDIILYRGTNIAIVVITAKKISKKIGER